MSFPPNELSAEAIEFLTGSRSIAALATTRADGRPHVASVGFTYDHDASSVRVVTMPGSQKVRNVEAGSAAVLNHIEGMRWLQLAGPARVLTGVTEVAEAYERFAARYGRVHEGDTLVVVEMTVQRCLGPHNGWGRIGFDPGTATGRG